ncbi:terminase TerL endonuclease subunit [Enterobacter hormaechei subsp. xiangfangensis]|uniref:terminase large subunit n=1 Tax=Enterobacter cloacae complex TaxID=354276 RepID=UPI0009502FC3|nr:MULTISPECIES: terminase TerL endonuclease subunit [Enterobacter cloacae complex]ELC7452831.1 terminase large subunit [Enterobacter hormaechei]ELJ6236075.1 terminase large subunit [Enterobacter hormaechei]ELZ5039535.1 terminase large subunit [Enterobacter hormaechei]MBT1743868.1 terminase large subunit [Enterobacter hormaechei subsp. xiangfangensis]MCM8071919.1 terminase large subunit [Enterobacter hormaechei]
MAAYPSVNMANQYARDVLNGKILACKSIQLACQRHFNDLKISLDKDYPYRFDRELAERACRFVQLLPHSSGDLAGQKLKLEPWQAFAFSSIFGWVTKKTKKRQFREAYIRVARKNGKSFFAAGIGTYMFCADGENSAEVYCGATTMAQAKKVFTPARQMADRLPSLRSKFNISVWVDSLTRPDGSLFAPIAGKPGDGDSPHCAIIDEYHEHDTDHMYEAMTLGMGARSQPLTLIITTAGTSLESPCYDKDKQVKEMLNGHVPNDRLFGLIYELDEGDDWTDPTNFIKANPNLDVSISYDDLLAEMEVAKQVPRKVNAFKTKRLNIWVSGKAAFYNMTQWHAAADKSLRYEDFAGEDYYLGLDLAQRLDLNAGVGVFVREIEGKKHYYCIRPKFWVPEDTVRSTDPKIAKTADRYVKFVEMGALEATDGAEADYREILASIIDLQEIDKVRVSEIPIDPSGATALSHELQDHGFEPISIRQDYTNMSPPMKELEAALAGGRFHHDGNPVLSWCISNVIGKNVPGSDDIVRPTKGDKQSKIDGATALFMAIGRAMLNGRASNQSVYDEEDVAC